MGKYDDAMYRFLSDNERFADLFNGVLFGGRQVLHAEVLEGDSERYVLERPDDVQLISTRKGAPQLKTENRFRDIKKRMKCGTGISVLAIENQATIVHPIYTLCLYHGTERWDGPRSLRDMMDCAGNEEFCETLFHDYRMTLVCVEDLKDLSVFHTDLRLLLETLTARKDRDKMKELFKGREFSNLSVETARTIAIMTDNMRVLEKLEHNENNGKEEVNMCQAWDEIMEECKAEGMEQGIERERVSSIRHLKENLKMTTEQAMRALNIPEDMFVYYLQLV